jgi:hypothetical protein
MVGRLVWTTMESANHLSRSGTMMNELAVFELARVRQADLIAEAQGYHRAAASRRRRRARKQADLGSRSPVRAGPRLPEQRQEAPVEQKVA